MNNTLDELIEDYYEQKKDAPEAILEFLTKEFDTLRAKLPENKDFITFVYWEPWTSTEGNAFGLRMQAAKEEGILGLKAGFEDLEAGDHFCDFDDVNELLEEYFPDLQPLDDAHLNTLRELEATFSALMGQMDTEVFHAVFGQRMIKLFKHTIEETPAEPVCW